MATFCKYLERISVRCHPCVENRLGACHIKLGLQEYYPKEFALYDTIQIIRHDSRLTVESDIEVKYKTEYPTRVRAAKSPISPGEMAKMVATAAASAAEMAEKEKRLRGSLEPKLPLGVRLLFHTHYDPLLHDPEIVALHIHARKLVEDLDEAKLVVEQLVKEMSSKEMETIIQ